MTRLFQWASRYPEQAPTIAGEFAHIAAFTPRDHIDRRWGGLGGS